MPAENVTAGLPTPRPPPFSTEENGETLDFGDITSEIGVGLAIVPLLAVIENVAIAKAFCECLRGLRESLRQSSGLSPRPSGV